MLANGNIHLLEFEEYVLESVSLPSVIIGRHLFFTSESCSIGVVI